MVTHARAGGCILARSGDPSAVRGLQTKIHGRGGDETVTSTPASDPSLRLRPPARKCSHAHWMRRPDPREVRKEGEGEALRLNVV